MIGMENVSLRIYDAEGKIISEQTSLLHGEVSLNDGETLSLRSIVKLKSWPTIEGVLIPCTITGISSQSELVLERWDETKGYYVFTVSTSGKNADEVIKLHQESYAMLVPNYKAVFQTVLVLHK